MFIAEAAKYLKLAKWNGHWVVAKLMKTFTQTFSISQMASQTGMRGGVGGLGGGRMHCRRC